MADVRQMTEWDEFYPTFTDAMISAADTLLDAERQQHTVLEIFDKVTGTKIAEVFSEEELELWFAFFWDEYRDYSMIERVADALRNDIQN